MKEATKALFQARRSVRTYDGRALTEEDRDALLSCFSAQTNPFSVPVDFRLLDAGTYGLQSPVIVGAKTYIAAKTARVPHFEIAYGYAFESVCLFALARGIGTVMLAASLNRAAFERAMEVGEGEVMPLASPVGYPAEKMSVRETLMRKGLKADSRRAFESLFYEKSFDRALRKEDAGIFADALEAVRAAPSAANGQPWRAVVDGDAVHFYEAKSMKDSPLGDVQKVDIGIALSHFDRAREDDGVCGSYAFSDPGIALPDHTHYIVSFRREP